MSSHCGSPSTSHLPLPHGKSGVADRLHKKYLIISRLPAAPLCASSHGDYRDVVASRVCKILHFQKFAKTSSVAFTHHAPPFRCLKVLNVLLSCITRGFSEALRNSFVIYATSGTDIACKSVTAPKLFSDCFEKAPAQSG